MRTGVPEEELLLSGHGGCPGCAEAQAYRYILKALGPKTIVTAPGGCFAAIAGGFPWSSLRVPVYHTAFASAASTGCGIRAGLDAMGDTETVVLVEAGDGGTFDIGLQALSAAAERNERIIFSCHDNEAYMMTGVQRSSATPPLAWTTTTPLGSLKEEPKKDIDAIMIAHRIPYLATATVAFPEDLIAKFEAAKRTQGFSFVHVLTPCPTGWRMPPDLSIRASRLAVETKYFPLYEVRNGVDYRITVEPRGRPVRAFMEIQGRYAHLTAADHDRYQAEVDEAWARLVAKSG